MSQPEENRLKHAGGRPLKFKTAEELQQAINAYFDSCDPHQEDRLVESGINERGETIFMRRKIMTEQKPYLVSGLAFTLGISRETLIKYKERNQFSDSINAAYQRCHMWAESQLYGRAANGAAFSLKNNWGYRDKQEIDHTTKGQAMPLLVAC